MSADSAHPSALTDVLVVGGGPSGAATALVLARLGHRVTLVDHHALGEEHPDRVVGLLPPHAVSELDGLEIGFPDHHRITQVRFSYLGTESSGITDTAVVWPTDPRSPVATNSAASVGYATFKRHLLRACETAGVQVLANVSATSAIVERGFVRGAHVVDGQARPLEVRSRFTVIADGANSRFGRQLGTVRQPSWPFAFAHRAAYECRLSTTTEVDVVIGLRDAAETALTGQAWMVPGGDGTASVALTIMSTSPSFRVLNPDRLLDDVVAANADRWRIATTPIAAAVGRRLPLGLSVGPLAGPNYLVVGDAAGAANPMTAVSIGPALETGRLAGEVLHDALSSGAAAALQQYPQRLQERFGEYYKVGRLGSRMISHPLVSQRIAQLIAGNRMTANAAARIGFDLLRPSRFGAAEAAYRVARAVNAVAPNA